MNNLGGGAPLSLDLTSPVNRANDATSKIDDVLTEHGGLIHVLPLAVHLIFFCWIILNLSYSLTFYVGPFVHA